MKPERFQKEFLARIGDWAPFRHLLDLVPDVAFFMKDRTGRFVMQNRRACEFCQANHERETLGKTDYDFFPKDRAALYVQGDQEVMQNGRPIINAMAPAPENSDKMIVYSKVPVNGRDGRIIGVAGIHRILRGAALVHDRENEPGVERTERTADLGNQHAVVAEQVVAALRDHELELTTEVLVGELGHAFTDPRSRNFASEGTFTEEEGDFVASFVPSRVGGANRAGRTSHREFRLDEAVGSSGPIRTHRALILGELDTTVGGLEREGLQAVLNAFVTASSEGAVGSDDSRGTSRAAEVIAEVGEGFPTSNETEVRAVTSTEGLDEERFAHVGREFLQEAEGQAGARLDGGHRGVDLVVATSDHGRGADTGSDNRFDARTTIHLGADVGVDHFGHELGESLELGDQGAFDSVEARVEANLFRFDHLDPGLVDVLVRTVGDFVAAAVTLGNSISEGREDHVVSGSSATLDGGCERGGGGIREGALFEHAEEGNGNRQGLVDHPVEKVLLGGKQGAHRVSIDCASFGHKEDSYL